MKRESKAFLTHDPYPIWVIKDHRERIDRLKERLRQVEEDPSGVGWKSLYKDVTTVGVENHLIGTSGLSK